MNILIVNQPLNNRGDEAAHRSLINRLNIKFSTANITVLFSNVNQNSINQIAVNSKQNKYININGFSRGSDFLMRWSLRLGLIRLSTLHPFHRQFANYIKKSDLIICAPGGICMGLFQNWRHIYRLALALVYKKKIAYYSRSIGPFPTLTKWNRLFKKVSYYLLNHFDFISLRDSKSMKLADEIGISYVPSIDTAFLDTPRVEIPKTIRNQINNNEYIVFVPNTLTWHPAFKNCPPEYLEKFYCSIIKLLFKDYPNVNILMLPQLFNLKDNGDYKYFMKLKKEVNSDRIIVLKDSYSSDIQQTIISKAKLLIGARYHSVVFAINNEIPFVALSYEHKISGLLKILDKEDTIYNMEKFGTELPEIQSAIHEIRNILKLIKPDIEAKNKAKEIAQTCFFKLIQKYNIA